MLTIEKLQNYGADVDEGLNRCMKNEAFYLRLVNMALDDAGFARLKEAVDSGNMKEGFEAAHALKGMLGNLALTPLASLSSEMTELFRAGTEADYSALLQKLEEQRNRLLALRDEG